MAKGGTTWLVVGLFSAAAIGIVVWLGTGGVLPLGDVLQIVLSIGSLVASVLQMLERYSSDPTALAATAGLATSAVVIINNGTYMAGPHPIDGQGRCPACGGDV